MAGRDGFGAAAMFDYWPCPTHKTSCREYGRPGIKEQGAFLPGRYNFYFGSGSTFTSPDGGRVQKGPPRAGLTVNPPILAIKRKHDNNDYQT